MRRKTVTLTPAPAPLCLPQAVSRFQQATLILQQIAARLDAEEKGRAETKQPSALEAARGLDRRLGE